MPPEIPPVIYKICRADEWGEAQATGIFRGSTDDQRDGFIHFSTAEQSLATYQKYFAGQTGLLLVAVDTAVLGPALKWEVSRGGALFPHLYGELALSAVRWSRALNSANDLRQFGQ